LPFFVFCFVKLTVTNAKVAIFVELPTVLILETEIYKQKGFSLNVDEFG
jgi:hypothetical protein